MRKHPVRPFGAGIPAARSLSLLVLLLIVGVCVARSRQPGLWTWLAIDDSRQLVLAAEEVRPAGTSPTNPSGPDPAAKVNPLTNQSPDEWAAFEVESKALEDRQSLRTQEMPAYWRLLQWVLAEPFLALRQRAGETTLFVNLWEEPDEHRGKPVRLKLNVRRVLTYAAGENTLGITKLYEAWGWTDDSKSFPYVVVFPELPEGLPLGADVSAEVEFVGYFLKVMAYHAFETRRGAPLLIGQVRLLQPAPLEGSAPLTTRDVLLWGAASLAMLLAAIWFGVRQFQQDRPKPQNPAAATIPDAAVPGEALSLESLKLPDEEVVVGVASGHETMIASTPPAPADVNKPPTSETPWFVTGQSPPSQDRGLEVFREA